MESVEGFLENISFVLVRPRSPGNIGSTARAMKNYGLRDLRLVEPADFHNDEAWSMACNASDLLLGAKVFKDLGRAVEGAVVAGTTRRKGKYRSPVLSLDEAVEVISGLAAKNRVAVLFGREDRGLENSEIELCDILFEIPSHQDYPSLNLSHAVLIVAFSLFRKETPCTTTAIETAPAEDIAGMYEHLESALIRLGYAKNGNRHLLDSILKNFKRLFGRTGLMEKEVRMLRGILSRIEDGGAE